MAAVDDLNGVLKATIKSIKDTSSQIESSSPLSLVEFSAENGRTYFTTARMAGRRSHSEGGARWEVGEDVVIHVQNDYVIQWGDIPPVRVVVPE